MATRVYLFLEENVFELEARDGAKSESERCIDNHRISVSPGHNLNHANLVFQCGGVGLTLKLSICDLWQEKSPMLASMEQSVVEDTADKDFDWWDQIPPFGIVELYGIELGRGKKTTEVEVKAFFVLLEHFLLKHFMMFAFRESEIQTVRPYIIDWTSCIKTFTHNGETGYRVKNFG